MLSDSRLAPTDAAFEEAARWQARLREPDAPSDLQEEFAAWLARDSSHAAAFAEAGRMWAALAVPSARVAQSATAGNVLPFHLRRPRLAVALRRVAMAATLALTVGIGGWLTHGGFDDLRSDYVARTGQTRTLTLADGSKVLLNTDSALAASFQPGRRDIRLFRGEARFDVARDTARPFVIATPAGTVSVLGTSFNLRIDGDQATVSVLEGQVMVAPVGAEDAGMASVRSAVLAAGQQATFGPISVEPPKGFDATSITAWQRGQLVFYRTPLGEVVRELNRYQRGHIFIASERLSDLQVTGVFDAAHPAAAIDVIESTLQVQALRLTDRFIVLR